MAAISNLHWFPPCGRWKDHLLRGQSTGSGAAWVLALPGGKWRLLDIIVKITDLQLPGPSWNLSSMSYYHQATINPRGTHQVLDGKTLKNKSVCWGKLRSDPGFTLVRWVPRKIHSGLASLSVTPTFRGCYVDAGVRNLSYRSGERGSGERKSSQHPHHRRLKNVLATADPKKTSRGWNLIVLIVSLTV